jgi:hypothetical protein
MRWISLKENFREHLAVYCVLAAGLVAVALFNEVAASAVQLTLPEVVRTMFLLSAVSFLIGLSLITLNFKRIGAVLLFYSVALARVQ